MFQLPSRSTRERRSAGCPDYTPSTTEALMQFTKTIAFFVSTLALPGIQAFSQAHVTENQTTLIYVDAKSGSDSNSGTQSSPLRTIQAAVTKAKVNNTKS